MIKVMLIDDEYIILDGMSSFPWGKYDCELVATAQNGLDGLAQMRKSSPDIVFSDIKMPGMDGLQFAEEARKTDSDIKIVFLTGYDNFEFAQQAIRVGVSEYLLKPINLAKLDALIKKLVSEINDEKSTKAYFEHLADDFQKELPLLRDKFVSDVIRGRFYNQADYLYRASVVNISIKSFVCIVITPESKENNFTAPEAYGIRNICKEVVDPFCNEVLCEYDDLNQQFTMIMLFDNNDDHIRSCIDGCEKLFDVLEKTAHINVSIGISTAGNGPEHVSEKYREACQANGQSIYLGEHAIVKYDDLESKASKHDVFIPEGIKQHLFRNIYTGKDEYVNSDLNTIFDESYEIKDSKYLALEILVDCMQYPSLCMINCDIAESQIDYSFLQDGIRVIMGSSTREEIIQYLLKVFALLSKQVNRNADDHYQIAINKIVEYMQLNYDKDLSLESVASQFYMSRTYLARLLKKYSGRTFLAMLVDIRMEEARKMVIDNKYKLYEIAEKVGYHDFSYFIHSFKKYYGVTPNEYRKNI